MINETDLYQRVKKEEQDNLRPNFYRFVITDGADDNVIGLCDINGMLITIETAKVLLEGLQGYVEKIENSYIEEFNDKIKLKQLKELEKNKIDYCYAEKVPTIVKGYVYFVLDDNGNCKIGTTKDLKKRLGEYTMQAYVPILHHTIKTNDCYALEEMFHKRYNEKRVRGEWFKLTDKDLEDIKKIPIRIE